MIIAGERRWRAANLAGLQEVPCIELDIDANGVAEIALIENLQRKDLTIWEEADGLKALAEKFGYTQDQIAKKISKSRTTVTELMTVAGIPETIRKKCHSLNIAAKSTLLEIARQFDDDAMLKLVNTLGNGALDREAVRKTARADRAPLPANGQDKKNETAGLSRFQYEHPNGEFNLQIKFKTPGQVNKSSILKALKETFDGVKKDEIAGVPRNSI